MEEFCYLEFKLIDIPDEQKSNKSGIISFIESLAIKILGFIFPKANPDFDNLYGKVKNWKIEYNLTENSTERELGYDKDENLIVIAPFKENLGFWVDNNLMINDYNHFKPLKITKEEFDKDWISFNKK